MKKIAIITYHFSDNFGSILQSYALQSAIEEKGYNCNIIDYRKSEVKNLYKIFKPNTSKYNIITNIYSLIYYKRLKMRKNRYEQFRSNKLKLTKKEYNYPEELNELNKYYDVFVCGSDQVWNTGIIDFDLSFVLNFVTKKRVSYAASCGPNKPKQESLRVLINDLNKFSHVLVRENTTKQVLEKILDKEVSIVADPVFLLQSSKWEELIDKRSIKEDYILCYFPGGTPFDGDKISKEYAKKHKCKRVILMPEWRNIFRTGVKQYDAGPIQFLDLIKNAKHVFTNSFHGTAFSVIFNTPFSVVSNNNNVDERIFTLLDICGMEKNKISSINDIKECNFDIANKKITELRNNSIERLKLALED